ncbi:Uncharacterised protein [Mycobacteroides abscessus subsp. abscessus]|nr:Uncharacterised protein [Mycobacteroides abscessus subsp. abscessus]
MNSVSSPPRAQDPGDRSPRSPDRPRGRRVHPTSPRRRPPRRPGSGTRREPRTMGVLKVRVAAARASAPRSPAWQRPPARQPLRGGQGTGCRVRAAALPSLRQVPGTPPATAVTATVRGVRRVPVAGPAAAAVRGNPTGASRTRSACRRGCGSSRPSLSSSPSALSATSCGTRCRAGTTSPLRR